MTSLAFEPLVNGDHKYECYPWQTRDLNYLAPMPYSANWSQMGAFKTSTGLWLLEKKRVRNALIITSKVGKGAYFSDFYKCLPSSWELYNVGLNETTRIIEDFSKIVDLDEILVTIKTGKHNHSMILLIHYDCFSNRNKSRVLVEKLRKIEWDMILCDEAHKLKNPKTQWTRNIKKIKAKNKHIMTGTGFVNNPAEMWSLLNFLHKDTWSNYDRFRTYFCDEIINMAGFRQIVGLRSYRIDEFRDLRKKLGPRHTMAEVHSHITAPIETTREVELNPTQRRMYREIKSVLQTLDQAGETLASPNVLSQLNRLRQISVATPKVVSHEWSPNQNRMVYDIELIEPSAKLDQVMDILAELDEADQQVVVFSCFKDPLKLLERRLDTANISYLHMEQKHSEAQRYKMWHDDFPNKRHKVFLSTLALGGESINLSCASYLIFLDRSWSPAQMLQAVGRVYRPGQKGACEIIYINARSTVDSYVKGKLDLKGKWFNEIFGEDQS